MFSQYEVPSSDVMVNFGVGQPNTNNLPLEWFNDIIKNINLTNKNFLQYHCIEGYPNLINKMKNWLEKKYYKQQNKINNNELFMTNGNSGALFLLMTLLMKQGDTIIIENPTYFLAKNIFEEFGLKVEYIDMEADGLDTKKLNLLLDDLCTKQERVFLYTIPFFHNPTSISLSDTKKIQISEYCNKYNNFYVLSDEVYHFLYFNEYINIPYPFANYHENILSLGSFSKILSPAIRVGWIYQKNGKIIDPIEAIVEGKIANEFVDGGFGFDPCFIPNLDLKKYKEHQEKSYGQLPIEIKNEISHRAIAFRKLKKFFC